MQSKLSRYCEGIIEATWLSAVIIIPVFFNIYSSRIFEPDKIAIFRSLALLALSSWFIKVIDDGGIHWSGIKNRLFWRQSIWKIPMLVPVFGMVLIYVVATIFSISPGVSLWGSYQRLQGTYTTVTYIAFFLLLVGNLRKWNQVERLLNSIIIASLPVALYGLLQRYGLDPIPWAGNTTDRVAANMGNSIFVAAYLIMVVPLTIGRLVRAIRKLGENENRRWLYSTQIMLFLFIAALQLITIYLSQSRGPVIGLFTGGYFMALFFAFCTTKRWIRIAVICFAVVGGGLMWGFNLVSGPWESLRSLPGIGRFSMLLDPESTTALTRKYIWQGTVELVNIHPPLQFPDGETDLFNILRPLIGYGPESMYVAFNQFYPPELGHIEKRNASPDRSHNETWDASVTTGVLGLVAYLLIFCTAFYYAIKWLGFVQERKHTYLIAILMGGGALCGAMGFSLWRGIEYLGIGLPFGIMIGLLMYVSFVGITHWNHIDLKNKNGNTNLIVIMLLSVLIAHFIEINFGIAIVTTKMLFWIYAGILVVVGHILPARSERATIDLTLETVDEPDSFSMRAKRGGVGERVGGRKPKLISPPKPLWNQEMVIGGLLTAVIMVTLGYDYIINSNQSIRVSEILINSLTRLPRLDNALSAGVFALFIITLLVGVISFAVQNDFINGKEVLKTGLGALVIAGGVGIVFAMIYAGRLAAIARVAPKNQYDVLAQAQDIGGALAGYYMWITAIVMINAFFLVDRLTTQKKPGSALAIVATPVFLLLTVILAQMTNLRVIQADIVFKVAEPFVNSHQWKLATVLYQRALDLAPMEDHYYLFLGQSYLEQAKYAQSSEEQASLILKAEADLQVAQAINPLNTDYTANLARLYYWWATQAPDTETMRERGEIANGYFSIAVNLSPNNMVIWGEWAQLNFQVLNQPQKAHDLLAHAIDIDPEYSYTLSLMGDFYSNLASSANTIPEKVLILEKASSYYQDAVQAYNKRDTLLKSTYLWYLANTYIKIAEVSDGTESDHYHREAINALEDALNSDLPASNRWLVHETLAGLFATLGDKQTALMYANLAYENAPMDELIPIQTLIESIHKLP